MRYPIMLMLVISLGAVAATAGTAAKPAAADKPAAAVPESGDLYARLVETYLSGDFDALEKLLAGSAREIARLPKAEQADVAYVRQALAECRPPWWKACKAGKAGAFRPIVWETAVNATYDPSGKPGFQIKGLGRDPAVTFSWNPADIDSTAPGEHGFLKGELTNLGIWLDVGSAAALSTVTRQPGKTLSEKENLRLNLYSNFRSNVTALYYGALPGRWWGLHIFLAAFMPEYGKNPVSAGRRAIGSMLLAEVLKSAGKYPSLKLPDTLAAESAEEKLAIHFKSKVGRQMPWTLAEDKAFREAIRTFAVANGPRVFQSAQVVLPNNLTYAMIAEDDARLRPQRDAWVKAEFDKAVAKAKADGK